MIPLAIMMIGDENDQALIQRLSPQNEADALKRVGLAEKTGRGIDRIFEGSLIYGRTLPDYSATTSVTVSLFIPRCKPDVQLAKMIADEQSRLGRPMPINPLLVLNKLKDMPKSDVSQLSETLNLSETISFPTTYSKTKQKALDMCGSRILTKHVMLN